MTKLAGTLTGMATDLGAELGALRSTLGNGAGTAHLTVELRELRETLLRAAAESATHAARRDPSAWLSDRLDAIADGLRALAERPQPPVAVHGTPADNWDAAALLAQVKRIESSLVPVVSAAVEQRAGDTLLANKMVQIIELLEQLDARLTR